MQYAWQEAERQLTLTQGITATGQISFSRVLLSYYHIIADVELDMLHSMVDVLLEDLFRSALHIISKPPLVTACYMQVGCCNS